MNLLSRMGRWFRNKLSTPDANTRIRSPWVYGAGTLVTRETALSVPAVFGCISRITNAIAPHPWEIYEIKGRQRDLLPDDPLSWLLNRRPNPSTTPLAFRQAMLSACMAGDGNAYAEIQRDGRSGPSALWPIEPERVESHTQADGTMFYRVYQYSGGQVDVEASRIFHLRGFASVNGLVGDGIVYRASGAISIALAAQQFAAGYYANGTISSGALKLPKGARLDKKTIDRLREEWREKHTGQSGAYAPLFLEDGMEWQVLSPDADKSQLHAARAFAVEEIARYFGVPLHLLGVAQSAQGYGTNVEQLGIEFVKYTLAPWAVALQQEADIKLCPTRGPTKITEIDLTSLTQGDSKTQAEAFKLLKESGILNRNEIRQVMGWNTTGVEGDKFADMQPKQPAPQQIQPPAREDDSGRVAKEAASAIYSGALDRAVRKLKNRRADLERNAPEKAEANLEAERERVIAAVRAECAVADRLLARSGITPPNGALQDFLAAVEQGEPANLAADRLVATLEAM